MQPKHEWKNWGVFSIVILSLLISTMSVVTIGLCEEETGINVRFEILNGLGTQDYFTGDHFWYNITITNSGTTTINATYTVTVYNTTGGTMGEAKNYKEYLIPNDTATLYPNYTRLGKDEVVVYFMDTVGTYSVELTCNIPMSFYRYYVTGRYTVEHNRCHIGIDVMPSYQRLQNDRWNQYLQENEAYMNKVQAYIDQSKVETSNTKILAKMSVIVAAISVLMNVIALPKTNRKEFKAFIMYFMLVLVVIMVIMMFIL